MSIRNLKSMFLPASIAVIGASARPHSVGAAVLDNLRKAGFRNPVYRVNPKHAELDGERCYAQIDQLPAAPELAVICTPPNTVPGLVAQLGAAGTKAAVVLTGGMDRPPDSLSGYAGATLRQAMLDAARPHLLRILGPNCVGIIAPRFGLNASFAHANARRGHIAFVSQSGAMATAVLDWADGRGIGFSHFISLGDSADVDLGDVLDYLAGDPDTHAILVYMEGIRAARKFMSAARAAARNQTVVVVKAGRSEQAARAVGSHTGALAGSDNIYDAAIRRAGMLRVDTTEQLFDAVETLAHAHAACPDGLTILTNGGGPGIMAVDALARGGGKLEVLDADTFFKLDRLLPPDWCRSNPIDIIGDAPVERYADTLRALLQREGTHPLLLIHAPTAIVPSTEIAAALAGPLRQSHHPAFTCWMGGKTVDEGRRLFREAGIATFETPERAVGAFLQVVEYRRNQESLLECPPASSTAAPPDVALARRLIQEATASGRSLLDEVQAKQVLAAFHIPVVQTHRARDVDDALAVARKLGYPVVLKALSPDISHKSDVGGVALDIDSDALLGETARQMQQRIEHMSPPASLEGFSVQPMIRRRHAIELIVGAACDPVFGPVVLFGQGGTAVEQIRDVAVALPPLNARLARDMVDRCAAARLLAAHRDRPAVDMNALIDVIVGVSQMMCELPEIEQIDINPLLADEGGVMALDARIVVRKPAAGKGLDRLAILPYPRHLECDMEWDGRKVRMRPVQPQDEPAYQAFLESLEPEDVHARFFCMMRRPQHSQLARIVQIDYDREMAFLVLEPDSNPPRILGEARAMCDPDKLNAEFGIIIRSDAKGRGLGRLLLGRLIDCCERQGVEVLGGNTLAQNLVMQGLARHFGFEIGPVSDGMVSLRLALPRAGKKDAGAPGGRLVDVSQRVS